MGKRISWIVTLLLLFLLAGGLSFAVNLYFDWLWFQELGKTVVFTTVIYAKSITGTATLAIVFFFLYLNLSLANRGPGSIEISIPTPDGSLTAHRFSREVVRRAVGVISLLVALVVALRAAERWEVIWRWLKGVEFGDADPIFARDISYYFFTLPVMQDLVRLGLILCGLSLAGVVALYYFKGSLKIARLNVAGKSAGAGAHISLLAALFFLLLGATAWLDRFQLLFSRHELISGANYSDLHGRLPMLAVLATAALLGAVLWVYNAFSARNRAAIAAVVLYVTVLLVGNLYPSILQKFVVSPNELVRESPQIEHAIQATLRAYNLSAVEERNLSGDKAITPEDIRANANTIRSIRLWDHEPLLDAFSQIQEIRTYYDFISVDNDRYTMHGVPQQMMLSPREMDSASLPERNWINEHLTYTHGYGITLGPVNRVTPEGLPMLLVQDIPPRAQEPLLQVARPEIYYGELTRGYVVVKTDAKEFDYPSGEENVYSTYEGSGGVPVNSFLRKLLFAFQFRDPNIVLSPLVKNDSRFLYHRDLRSRLARLAPFLILDQDPYMVVSEGRLCWIQDAYTTSDRYPYSLYTRGVGNYIRNSVKLVLDAYNGAVDLYISDPNDPVIRTYQGIFPGLMRPIDEMPRDLRAHVRYPEDIFRLQTYIYAVYHMTNPQVFYNKEDQWEIPVIASAGGAKAMSPYYVIMRLPQEENEEFILMLPFTPRGKDNLSAWMVARSDGEAYGKLVVYRFPKQKLIFGPKQIVARINQDADISRQISLWDQRGSQVIQGTLLVIPIEEGLLYVRPLYLRAEAGKIPELKRVIVAYENRIAMEETLEASIARIFEAEVAPTAEPRLTETTGQQAREAAAPAAAADLVRLAAEAYDRAIQAQRQGDWAKYGEELGKLGAVLSDLQKSRR